MKEKSGLIPDPGLRELPNSEVPINISVMAEASDFKFGTELGFAESNYKITLKDKMGVTLVWGAIRLYLLSVLFL